MLPELARQIMGNHTCPGNGLTIMDKSQEKARKKIEMLLTKYGTVY